MTTITPTALGKVPPGPLGAHRIPGNVKALQQNAPRLFDDLRREYGDMVRLPLGLLTANLAYHPTAVKHVLQDNNANYIRGIGYERFKIFMGLGLLTTDGAEWRTRRRIVNPLFHRSAIDAMADTMVAATAEVLERWESAGHGPGRDDSGGDVVPDMMRITLGALGRIMFDTDLEPHQEPVGVAMQTAIEAMVFRGTVVQLLPSWLPFPYNRRVAAARDTMYDVVTRIITAHREGDHAGRPDLVNLLLESEDEETGRPLTDENVRDELMTVFMAGHETTGTGLAWALYELAANPDAQERMFEEVDAVFGGRAPELADVAKLEYTKMVTDETLRLHPPIWVYPREAVADDLVDGWHIPAGECLFLSPYVTHRHPDFWTEPTRFDPDRFDPAQQTKRPKFAFFPFGGGQRQCIGNSMALLQTHLTLAMIVSRFRIETVPGTTTDLATLVSLRPADGIRLRLTPRTR
ncbi:cytochrome P450 [Nocardia puris]|uniref:Cytochrome P450 n=1 Tax=Nocardia puris TaxID=208602 RepID=A0A366DJ66_9NOCA|nr:cytochrome P450 [Nocardia puris]MBF6212886.1 cytochrome P450 [Nocardia puris]MBF6367877.1 cytochrome P450 [Nocardia puris]MBF6463226.1 cytochrome P450 [Nocardia puris]RBO90132.1 cytochrome P450 [Nocardia puris]